MLGYWGTQKECDEMTDSGDKPDKLEEKIDFGYRIIAFFAKGGIYLKSRRDQTYTSDK